MARVEIIMPQLGESIAEGTVVKWLKAPGDKVGKDESVLEITTDKVDSEIPSPSAGVLVEIVAPEGTTAGGGKPLGILETDVAAAKAAPAPPQEAGAGKSEKAPQADGTPAAAAPPPPDAPAENIDTMPVAENATATAQGDQTRARETTERNEPAGFSATRPAPAPGGAPSRVPRGG